MPDADAKCATYLQPTMAASDFSGGRPCRSYWLRAAISLALICGVWSADVDTGARGLRVNGAGHTHPATEHDTAGHQVVVRAEHGQEEHATDLGMTWIEPENLPTEIQFERKLNMMGCGKFVESNSKNAAQNKCSPPAPLTVASPIKFHPNPY